MDHSRWGARKNARRRACKAYRGKGKTKTCTLFLSRYTNTYIHTYIYISVCLSHAQAHTTNRRAPTSTHAPNEQRSWSLLLLMHACMYTPLLTESKIDGSLGWKASSFIAWPCPDRVYRDGEERRGEEDKERCRRPGSGVCTCQRNRRVLRRHTENLMEEVTIGIENRRDLKIPNDERQ